MVKVTSHTTPGRINTPGRMLKFCWKCHLIIRSANRWNPRGRTPKIQVVTTTGQNGLGRSNLCWNDSEAKLNAKFSHIVKPVAYPVSLMASRPVHQETLCRRKICTHEGTYITNHAARFIRYTSEIQTRVADNIAFLHDCMIKGKVPKEIDALKDPKDLLAFCLCQWPLGHYCSTWLTVY